jgi:hypothetical protein
MSANADPTRAKEEMYRRHYRPERPPSPAVLFGQLAFALAVFLLIALISIREAPPVCDLRLGQAVSCFPNHAKAKTAVPQE